MAHTFTDLLYHVVFSTKERRPFIDGDLLPELTRMLGGIIRDRKGRLLECNGMPDHIHMLVVFHPTIAVSDMLKAIKAGATNWMHSRFGKTRAFCWQEGFSGFTVSYSSKDAVASYIRGQQTHHQKQTFEEEYVELLRREEIPLESYDPRFIFG
jgi:REP element-mobilizing transposase RayT